MCIHVPSEIKTPRGTTCLAIHSDKETLSENIRDLSIEKSLMYNLTCFSEHKKDPGIPNLFPFKEEILKQAEDKKRRVGNRIDLKLSCIVHVFCFTLKKIPLLI